MLRSSHKKPPLQLQPSLSKVTPSHPVNNKALYIKLPPPLNSLISSKVKHLLCINPNLLHSSSKKPPCHNLTKVTPMRLVNNKVLFHRPYLLLHKPISNKVMALL